MPQTEYAVCNTMKDISAMFHNLINKIIFKKPLKRRFFVGTKSVKYELNFISFRSGEEEIMEFK